MGLMGMEDANHEKKTPLQTIKRPFIKLMRWIGNAQKENGVCKS
jgi:hypothetical protein